MFFFFKTGVSKNRILPEAFLLFVFAQLKLVCFLSLCCLLLISASLCDYAVVGFFYPLFKERSIFSVFSVFRDIWQGELLMLGKSNLPHGRCCMHYLLCVCVYLCVSWRRRRRRRKRER